LAIPGEIIAFFGFNVASWLYRLLSFKKSILLAIRVHSVVVPCQSKYITGNHYQLRRRFKKRGQNYFKIHFSTEDPLKPINQNATPNRAADDTEVMTIT
jgi:hypothetical protein